MRSLSGVATVEREGGVDRQIRVVLDPAALQSQGITAASLKDMTLWGVTVGALLFLALVVYVPPLAHLFRFAPLGPLDVALCFGSGGLSVAWFEIVKRSGRARLVVPPAGNPATAVTN